MAELPIVKEYAESVCEVKTMNNTMIAIGKIKDVTEKYVRIYSNKNELRILSFGEELKVNIFNTKLGFKVIVGFVYTSTKGELSLINSSVIADKEKRKFFRVDMDIDAKIIFRKRGPSQEIDVKILDMSLSGLRFKSNHKFEKDTIVSAVLDLSIDGKGKRKNHTFPCKIVRVINDENDKDNEIQYGCEFTGDHDESSDALCSFLFKKQREFLNSRR